MRRAVRLVPLLLPLALLRSSPAPLPPVPDGPIAIRATPVALAPGDPARRSVGALRFLGGWHLESEVEAFGGLSGAMLAGDRIVAVSDAGGVVRIGLAGGRPSGRGHIAPLPPGCGRADYKRDRDAEAVTGDPDTGRYWISLERRNAICRLDGLSRTGAEVFPPLIADWPEGAGGEALVRLRDGRFLLWSEENGEPGNVGPLIRFDRDPAAPGVRAEAMAWRSPAGFSPVDAAQLPDGRVLLLYRRFTVPGWFRTALDIVDPRALRPGRINEGQAVARFDRSLVRDNFEALAVGEEAGRTIVWILSDDNFHFLQRTLLLKFALEAAR